MKPIRFTNTSVDEIGIDDSSRYPPNEFQEDDPSRQYQVDSDVSYYIIPHGCSLIEITQENHVPESVAMSSTEAEYVDAAGCCANILWMKSQLSDYDIHYDMNYSSTEQVNSIQQLLAYSLITRIKVDIGEIIYSDLVTKLLNKSRLKYVSYLRFISCALQVLMGIEYTQDKKFGCLPPILSNSYFTKDQTKVTDIELATHMIDINNQRDLVSSPPLVVKPKKGKSQTMTSTLPKSQGLEASGALSKKSKRPKSKKLPIKTMVTPPKLEGSEQFHSVSSGTGELEKESDEEEVLAAGDDMDEDPQDDAEVRTLSPNQTQPKPSHVQESASNSSTPDLKIFDNTLPLTERKLIKYLRKMSIVLFNRITSSMSSLDKTSSSISDLYKGLNVITELFKDINNAFKDDLTTNKKIDEAIKTFAKISAQTTEILSLPITSIISHPESSQATPRIDKGKRITTESEEDPLKKLVHASTIIRPYHDESVRVEFMINGKIIYLTKQEIQEYWDKEEKMKKVVEETKFLAMSRPEVIKVIREEAKKIKINLKEVISTKAGETFKKAQDVKHEVLKREHTKKVKRLTELNERRAEEYMWTMTNRIKPEPISDVKIHPNTKPIIASVYRNNDKRNFDVHSPFKFTDFRITELDELGPIIQKKKNYVVNDLMISLSKRYERLKKIPEELRIQSALPALVPEQVSSQTLGRKRKHMELEPKIKVPMLECNNSLPESVPFVNNMVIKEPKYGICFTYVFGDQAFQR
uniref:Retrovirus-related Pol polyprotein from transposon TNT 1-94 n=1 Tax=Tanacetum cinerariifolium TaxID=118510 RepID=A0A6L2NGU4_TANCI|nr:retrovirus-related Pol polyprotein from transposon TNT 1-94 [Tanacetum cinerariifolium]